MSEPAIAVPDLERFKTFTRKLIGLPITPIWRGYGSALFLEFGELKPWFLKNGRRLKNDRGAMSLKIEWSWRIENESSIIAGTWSEEDKWSGFFQQLLGSHVINI